MSQTGAGDVSIHAPARGATWTIAPIDYTPKGFNSRTREGCDQVAGDPRHPHLVSIHAPARGATWRWRMSSEVWRVSIHAPARGATLGTADGKGGDRVSIHAPARGATISVGGQNLTLEVSIHAPARGATAGMGRWLWSCLYRPALAKVLKLSLLSGAAST